MTNGEATILSLQKERENTLKQLIIVGAGGFGREIASASKDCVGFGATFALKGFLDRNAAALAGFAGYPPLLGAPESYQPQPDDVFFVAMGNLALRRKNVELLAAKGGRFLTLVHRTASLGQNVTVGEGSYIAHNAVLTADVSVGRNACVFHGSVIGHDCRLGDFSHVSSLVFFGGGVQLGAGATVHPGARVAPFRSIGAGATVGIGSVVLTNVRAGATVFGTPALDVEG